MADMTAAFAPAREVAAPDSLAERFAAAAERAGLIDVAYATYDAPFGQIVLGGTEKGLVRLAFAPVESVVEDLAARVSPRVLRAPARLDGVRRELDEYFAGTRSTFEVDVDLRLAGSDFRRSVLAAADAIPYGEVRTYGDVARVAGNAGAVRAVGTALGANPVCIVVPCHRVLRSDGTIGGYAGGPERKNFLLHLEGAS